MPVFQVYLNGKKVSTAGVGELGVLSAHVTWVRRGGEDALSRKPGSVEEELTLDVGGLVSPTNEHLRWLERKLKIGDEVSIRVVEDAQVDRPRRRWRRDPSEELRSKKRYVRELARQFGWKIQTS